MPKTDPPKKDFLIQLLDRESDRGAVLAGAAMLDSRLETMLRATFSPDRHVVKHAVDPLFSPMSPLHSFSAKIRVCYSLRLLSRSEFRDLEIVRRLRNSFAHDHAEVDFLSPEIRKQVDQLSIAERVGHLPRYSVRRPDVGEGGRLSEHEMASRGMVKYPRGVFVVAVSALLAGIRTRTEEFSLAR